jgi:hypothetical protein
VPIICDGIADVSLALFAEIGDCSSMLKNRSSGGATSVIGFAGKRTLLEQTFLDGKGVI